MLILFLALLDLTLERRTALNPRLTPILAMMLAISGIAAWVGHFVSPQIAAVAFVLAMAPTATAAPVMTQFLEGRVQYVMVAVVVTNSFSALVLPLALPMLAPEAAMAVNVQGLLSTLSIIVLPLALAQALKRWLPQSLDVLRKCQGVSFYVWLLATYLATARATVFITLESGTPFIELVEIAAVAMILCAVNFSLGHWLGGVEWAQEMGQSLGQKNTLFMIWVCLTFLNPAIALGPTFYIVFQNLYNAYLLAKGPRLQPALSPS
jgi:BASS family bile acid:Na+ symporter